LIYIYLDSLESDKEGDMILTKKALSIVMVSVFTFSGGAIASHWDSGELSPSGNASFVKEKKKTTSASARAIMEPGVKEKKKTTSALASKSDAGNALNALQIRKPARTGRNPQTGAVIK